MEEAIVGTAVGLAFLHAFYAVVASRWPESYMSVGSGIGYVMTRTPVRYALFRLGPVTVTCAFLAVTLARLQEPVVAPVMIMALLHWAVTSGRGVIDSVRRKPVRRPLIALHIVLLFAIIAIAMLTILTRRSVAPIIPSLSDIASSLWTALAAGIVGAYLIHATQPSYGSEESAFLASRRAISDSVAVLADRAAIEHAADPILVRAVMIVENIERPPWFRRLERMKGRLIRAGTYGVMQVRSNRPLTDEESVELAVREHLSGVSIPSAGTPPYTYPDRDAIVSFAKSYNPDTNFATAVASAYYWVREQWPPATAPPATFTER